eukprot:CAMPEP_0176419152 /NCGR_PEP_ID=MMETSP0127-20121128/7882_1 /TAXON_ID=938130 /ORGANISM="Platyophrya macrostoma, Strain WH" /LENGTH=299 /DNA_ID=CAMNT_0017799585 /DNA_START=63 /DNA_END=959 /DNA_ORIENTATION=+
MQPSSFADKVKHLRQAASASSAAPSQERPGKLLVLADDSGSDDEGRLEEVSLTAKIAVGNRSRAMNLVSDVHGGRVPRRGEAVSLATETLPDGGKRDPSASSFALLPRVLPPSAAHTKPQGSKALINSLFRTHKRRREDDVIREDVGEEAIRQALPHTSPETDNEIAVTVTPVSFVAESSDLDVLAAVAEINNDHDNDDMDLVALVEGSGATEHASSSLPSSALVSPGPGNLSASQPVPVLPSETPGLTKDVPEPQQQIPATEPVKKVKRSLMSVAKSVASGSFEAQTRASAAAAVTSL